MKGKNIVVVGGTSGIGRSLAEQLVPHNRVFIIGRSSDKVTEFAEQHRNGGGLAADMSLLRVVSEVVPQLREHLGGIDGVVHAADLIRVNRLDTTEGLEVSIATNYYSRVLFNQLLLMQDREWRPGLILHVAFAGFRPGRHFLSSFPISPKASSFKAHALGQIANDFYGLTMNRKLRGTDTQFNILNPGSVNTEIRRTGQFPSIVKPLVWLMERLIPMTPPDDYARLLVDVMSGRFSQAEEFTLIDSKGRGIPGSPRVNDLDTQERLYELTTREIDRVLGYSTDWA
ncbi:MAG: SDR family NAD(P)-dependent oxidoreductase [Myxococcota bacterium]